MPSRTAVYTSIAKQVSRPVFGPPRPRPCVVLLRLDHSSPLINDQTAKLVRLLKNKADVATITTPTAASALLHKCPKAIVFATDGGLSLDDNASLAEEARTFVRNGGTIIFCGAFASTKPSAIDNLFEGFGLSWETGECQRTSHEVNGTMQAVDTSCLSPSYSQQALHLRNVDPHDRVYHLSNKSYIQDTVFPPSPIEDLSQTPAAFATCGKGRLGFQGDVNGEPESIEVLLAMCGLR